jgi:hypothetical protein
MAHRRAARDMTDMNGFEWPRMLSALILIVMTLFVASGVAPAARWRRPLRFAAIAGFVIALAVALAEIVFWWTGPGR